MCFLFALHFLYNLQPREFFPFLFFQRVIDRIYQIAVHRDSNIFKRIGTLLGLLDIRRQPVCRVLDHRQLDGQILYLPERLTDNINRLMRRTECIGQVILLRVILHIWYLRPHDAAGLDPD